MKIAAVSDPHIGNFPKFGGAYTSGINERCAYSLMSLAQAVRLANEEKCKWFVINGDLFDIDEPSPQVEAAVIGVLQAFNGDVHIIVGNHDMRSASEGDHALGPLRGHATRGGQIHVYETATLVGDVLFAPYEAAPVGEWLPQALEHYRPKFVFAHFGIIDSATPEFMRHSAADAHDWAGLADMMLRAGTELLCVGNWHDPGSWTRARQQIKQVGALTPTGFDNPGPSFGHVLIIDTLKDRDFVTPRKVAGPRFVKLVWGADHRQELQGAGKHVYVSMTAEPDELIAARAWLKAEVAAFRIKDFTLIPNKVFAVREARAAAQATSLASSMQEALQEYVSKMPFADGVDRKAVHARVQKYLQQVGGLHG